MLKNLRLEEIACFMASTASCRSRAAAAERLRERTTQIIHSARVDQPTASPTHAHPRRWFRLSRSYSRKLTSARRALLASWLSSSSSSIALNSLKTLIASA